MHVSSSGLELIKEFEGYRAHPYQDAAGVWTIGYGHAMFAPEDWVKANGGQPKTLEEAQAVIPGFISALTKDEAVRLLAAQLVGFEAAVTNLVTVPLAQHEFNALVSFAYNVGVGERGFKGSTLLKKLNADDRAGAASEFARWNKGGGQVLPGLVRRRKAEALMFEGH